MRTGVESARRNFPKNDTMRKSDSFIWTLKVIVLETGKDIYLSVIIIILKQWRKMGQNVKFRVRDTGDIFSAPNNGDFII